MQCTLNLSIDLEKCRKFGKMYGAKKEAECYFGFVAQTVLEIADELRKNGVHPELIEQAIREIRFAPKVLDYALYRKHGKKPEA